MARYTAWMQKEQKTCGHAHTRKEHAEKCVNHFGGELRVMQDRNELNSFNLEMGPGTVVEPAADSAPAAPVAKSQKPEFSVEKRFEMLSKITSMVIQGYQRAEMVVGCGGTGKTYTILNEIKNAGLEEVSMGVSEDLEDGDVVDHANANNEYIKVTGATSPTGLYRLLYENRFATIVMDDCDGFLNNDNAVNLLKSVLDTTGDGVVSWNSPKIDHMGLPRSFQFNGKLIFISNKKINQVPQPLLSRSLVIDMDMNNIEIVERARMLADGLLPNLTVEQRNELFDFVSDNINYFRDVSLRTFVLASPYVEAGIEDWKDYVLFTG